MVPSVRHRNSITLELINTRFIVGNDEGCSRALTNCGFEMAAKNVHARIDAGGLGGKIVLLPWLASQGTL
jgi:hypothetical protein